MSSEVSFHVRFVDFDCLFFGNSTCICKGVLNQNVGMQPAVFRFSYVVIHRLPRHSTPMKFLIHILFGLCVCILPLNIYMFIKHEILSNVDPGLINPMVV